MRCDLRLESPLEFGKKIVSAHIPHLVASACAQATTPAKYTAYTRLKKRNDKAKEIDGFGAARSAEHAPSQIPADRPEEEVRIEKHEVWMVLHHGPISDFKSLAEAIRVGPPGCKCVSHIRSLFRFTPILVDLPRSQTANSRLDVENADRAIANVMQDIEEG
jgi:hypothetical protein